MSTRKRLSPALLLLGMLCVVDAALAQQENSGARIHLEQTRDSALLIWSLERWPDDAQAFVVRYRSSQDASWIDFHDDPIVPGLSANKDLSNVEPNGARRQQLQQALAEMLATNNAMEVSSEDFIRTVRASPEILQALRREVFEDHRRALLIGLGLFDRSIAGVASRQYGLFSVSGNGSIGDAPLATADLPNYQDDDDRLRAAGFVVLPSETGLRLSWQFTEAQVSAASAFAFSIYRAPAGSDEFTRISPDGGVFAAPDPDGVTRVFDYLDRTADPVSPYRYAVAPVNVFGTELPVRTYAAVVDVESGESIVPGDITVSRNEDGNVVLTWNLPGESANAIAALYVERNEFPQVDAINISGDLGPTERTYTDDGPMTNGDVYGYRVVAVDTGGQEWASALRSTIFSTDTRPGVPTNVAAQCVSTGDKRLIRISWGEPISDDSGTNEELRYAIYADKGIAGQVQRQASIPPVAGREYVLEVPSQESRNYTVGVAARLSSGLEGEHADASCFVRGRLPAAVENLSRTETAPGEAAVVAWQYEREQDIRGFRVFANQLLLADEGALGPAARAYPLAGVESDTVLSVVAVSIGGEQSSARQILIEATTRTPEVSDAEPGEDSEEAL